MLYASKLKLTGEALFVNTLEKPRSKLPMHFDCGADHDPGELFKYQTPPCLGASVVDVTHVCSTPTLNSGTSGFNAAASNAQVSAWRVSTGSMMRSIHNRAAP